MKRFATLLIFIAVAGCSATKSAVTTDTSPSPNTLDRTYPPAPGPAPEIQLGEYQHFTLDNGMKVYVVENDKLPRVAFSLQVDRDPVLEGDKAGLITIAGDLLSRGTEHRSKAEIDEAVDFIGATFSTGSSSMYGSSLTKHADELLSVMQDVLLHPTFPQDELDKLIKLSLSNLASEKDDPTSIVNNIRNLVVYGKNHPFGEMVTEESLQNITREDCIEYFNTYWDPSATYMAVVGDITVPEAKRLVEKYFGGWNGQKAPEYEYAAPALPEETTVILVDRPQSVQSVIRVAWPVEYKLSSDDYFAAKLMNMILGGNFSARLMQNLREDKGFTYGASSGISANEVIGRFTAGASVRNEVTDSSVYELLYELRHMVNNGVTEAELNAAKAYITGSFARSLENPQTIAGFAINTAVNGLPADFYATYLRQLDAVTVEDVNAAARKYLKPEQAYVIVVGKADEIAEGLKVFGPIKYYDTDGNAYDPGSMNKALEGMSADAVLDKYFAAIGGKEALRAIENEKQVWAMSTGGIDIEVTSLKTQNGKFRTDMSMGGQVQQSVISDGKRVVTMSGGRELPMDEPSMESERLNNRLYPELYYKESGVNMKLTGVEKVNGAEAFRVEVIFPSGKSSQVYFDTENFLKVKETNTIETPQGSFTQAVTYSDYQPVDNSVLYPFVSTIQMGPQKIDSHLKVIKLNSEIEGSVFELP